MTTTTPVTIDPATMLKAKANLALFMIALGVPLLILSSYGLLRQAFNRQAGAAQSYAAPLPQSDATPGLEERAPGLYQRSQPVVPVPTITYEVVPVPTSVGPTLGVAPIQPDPNFGKDFANNPFGCAMMEDSHYHCWGGAEMNGASDQESYWIDDDTGQCYTIDAQPQPIDCNTVSTGFRTGASSQQSSINTTHHDGPWAAPGYSTGSGMSGMRGGN